uniref:Putative secreted protein n=1 Tax=Anopheles darlingi TaxID=43151 RepID=A0A2M4DI00_ANODA
MGVGVALVLLVVSSVRSARFTTVRSAPRASRISTRSMCTYARTRARSHSHAHCAVKASGRRLTWRNTTRPIWHRRIRPVEVAVVVRCPSRANKVV